MPIANKDLLTHFHRVASFVLALSALLVKYLYFVRTECFSIMILTILLLHQLSNTDMIQYGSTICFEKQAPYPRCQNAIASCVHDIVD